MEQVLAAVDPSPCDGHTDRVPVEPGDLPSAKERGWRELAPIDAALEAGEIDEDEWHRRVLDVLEPAYLAASTPEGQSGRTGDAAGWERARRLILDAVDRDGTFLDIGCANGLLMETIARWAAEDGLAIEPFGVEISGRLAALARRRLPRWADRIWTANARDFAPGRRFTYVRTGLDYVPAGRRAAYVEHVMDNLVEPGGRMIVGTYNEESESAGVAAALSGWGWTVAGQATRPHSHPELSYKVLWVENRR